MQSEFEQHGLKPDAVDGSAVITMIGGLAFGALFWIFVLVMVAKTAGL